MSEAHALRRWLGSGLDAVRRSRGRLDAINVFPVADADTGTNVYLTLEEGNRAIARLPADASHREVAAAFARGALMGARGNSGVIVSAYLSALLRVVDTHGGLASVDARGLSLALGRAAEAAYGAVGTPVEGTILTVAREAARVANDTAGGGRSRDEVIVAAVDGARQALKLTTDQLPSARSAGVVDAGAAALVLQLEMLAEVIAGEGALASHPEVAWELPGRRHPVVQPGHPSHGDADGGAYEVMFVAEGDGQARGTLLARLGEIGDSVTVTATHGLMQAHVHTDHPAVAVAAAHEVAARQIVVRSITLSTLHDRSATGVVALTACPGLAEPLADAGAVVLVVPEPGALGTRELQRAVRDASGAEAIVVAGHPLLLGAAKALADKRGRPRLVVIDSAHEARLVAAVAASALATPGEDVAALMRAAAEATVVGQSTGDALDEDLDGLVDSRTEVVTLVLARGIDDAVAEEVRASVLAQAPGAELAIYAGGQDWPPILIGVESAPA